MNQATIGEKLNLQVLFGGQHSRKRISFQSMNMMQVYSSLTDRMTDNQKSSKESTIATIYALMLFFLLAFDLTVVLPKLSRLHEYEKALCFPPIAHGF